jgi:hypothetical protein
MHALNPVEAPVGVEVTSADDGHNQQNNDNRTYRDSTSNPTRAPRATSATLGPASIVHGIAERE